MTPRTPSGRFAPKRRPATEWQRRVNRIWRDGCDIGLLVGYAVGVVCGALAIMAAFHGAIK